MDRPFFSIIIATYNSDRTLEYTLRSIDEQEIDKNDLEIIIVDGGSTDDTLVIAKKYNVKVLNNPKRLPEYAKAIGVRHANGYYVIRMDSDEEFSFETQLQEKKNFLIKHPEVKMLLANRYASGRKEICGISAEYMNIFGDPFSYFIYKEKYDKFDTYKKNIITQEDNWAVMRFEKNDIFPLADSATSILSLDYMRENYPHEYDSIEFTCGAYDRIIADTGLCGCIKGDNIRHNCSSSFKTYLSKLKFRVINNLFHKEESGFSAREGMSKTLSRRKLLFGLYAVIFPLPILDSIMLSIKYKNVTFLLHFIYLYYVCIQIFVFGVLKLMGKEVVNASYGK